jgi:hypothetical protein
MGININTPTRTKDQMITMVVISKAEKISSSTLSKVEMIIPIAIRIRSTTKIKERIVTIANQSINLPLTTLRMIQNLKQKS